MEKKGFSVTESFLYMSVFVRISKRYRNTLFFFIWKFQLLSKRNHLAGIVAARIRGFSKEWRLKKWNNNTFFFPLVWRKIYKFYLSLNLREFLQELRIMRFCKNWVTRFLLQFIFSISVFILFFLIAIICLSPIRTMTISSFVYKYIRHSKSINHSIDRSELPKRGYSPNEKPYFLLNHQHRSSLLNVGRPLLASENSLYVTSSYSAWPFAIIYHSKRKKERTNYRKDVGYGHQTSNDFAKGKSLFLVFFIFLSMLLLFFFFKSYIDGFLIPLTHSHKRQHRGLVLYTSKLT